MKTVQYFDYKNITAALNHFCHHPFVTVSYTFHVSCMYVHPFSTVYLHNLMSNWNCAAI